MNVKENLTRDNDWEKRRRLDFWLLAGMIGLWYYWLFLYRTGLLDRYALKSYLWLLKRNILPVTLFVVAIALALLFIRKGRRAVGTALVLLTIAATYWAYGPDLPKMAPLNPPKMASQQFAPYLLVAVAITYAHKEELPPSEFLRLTSRFYFRKTRVTEETLIALREQAKRAMTELVKKVGEDPELFERCLVKAEDYVVSRKEEAHVPLFAEKRYEELTGQLCWVIGFTKMREERERAKKWIGPYADLWVAVRLRAPQKAWETYTGIEPDQVFRRLLWAMVLLAGYGLLISGLRYAYQRWWW